MLPRTARLRRRLDFSAVTRRGRRAGSTTLVVHALGSVQEHARVGFAINRGTGKAVVRNRIARQLRHACRERLHLFVSVDVVVRALPAAAAADHDRLLHDLDSCLRRAGVVVAGQPRVVGGARC